MTEYIKVDKEQHGFVQRYVKEANISLNYLKDKGEDITDALENYRNVLSMIEAINRFNAEAEELKKDISELEKQINQEQQKEADLEFLLHKI